MHAASGHAVPVERSQARNAPHHDRRYAGCSGGRIVALLRARAHKRAALIETPEFGKSRDQRKTVEMCLVHLKIHHRFERMRGLFGARDEFHLRAIAQTLKTPASQIWQPPPDAQLVSVK